MSKIYSSKLLFLTDIYIEKWNSQGDNEKYIHAKFDGLIIPTLNF